jgi:hypothetical protein
MARFHWTPEARELLLSCATSDELKAAFPDHPLPYLRQQRSRFRHELAQQAPARKRATPAKRTTPVVRRSRTLTPAEVEPAVHIVIPDTQVKPGVPTDHLRWIGQYIVDHFAGQPNVRIIHLGDHADMPSLSSYDRGKGAMEGRRYNSDIKAANAGFDVLCKPLDDYNATQRRLRKPEWWPDRHFILGNHEDRISRACNDNAQLKGTLSLDDLNYAKHGWTVHPFLKPVFIDSVGYAHFWTNHMTGRPLGGMVSTRLKTIGHSFTMGHQQTLDTAVRFAVDPETGEQRAQWGLVAGACYLHDEDYKGYQGNAHWRGIVVCHAVVKGSYNPMFVDLDYLCRRYEGMSLNRWMRAQGLR